MTYHLFIDESGDHGLNKKDDEFPVFLLCGVLVEDAAYSEVNNKLNELKTSIWSSQKVILHSRDIRKCEKEFQKLFDLELKKQFYDNLNSIIQESDYSIIASAIQKKRFIEYFGKLQDDVYEVALSFVIEQAATALSNLDSDEPNQLDIVIEQRGKKEDKQLEAHFQRIIARGTGNLEAKELSKLNPTFSFKNKNSNNNGLQMADLLAYPIARYVLEPTRSNPAFDVLHSKIYEKEGDLLGLKIFP